MWLYIAKRLLLLLPTLFGILLINFFIIQSAPGGPVEQIMARYQNNHTADIATSDSAIDKVSSQQLRADIAQQLTKYYDLDKPLWEQFFTLTVNYLTFDFGNSLYRDISVIDLIFEKMPVSISLGLWTTLLVYLVSIPLGIYKAVNNGSSFDSYTSLIIVIGYAIPGFVLALIFIMFFAGGYYLQWFPLRGLTSDNFAQLHWYQQIGDYLWHIFLPVLTSVIGAFAALTMLTKGAFIEEINKQYVVAAYAQGLQKKQVLFGQIFRNAMLVIISGLPASLIGIFFTGSLLIEIIFSLDGLGMLGFNAILQRDYPVLFATLYLFTLMGLLLKIISDITFVAIDPRINFDANTK